MLLLGYSCWPGSCRAWEPARPRVRPGIPELYDINEDAGGPPPASDDSPCVQLMNNDGSPLRLGPIGGITNFGVVIFTDAEVQPAGVIRIGGWDYLSTGNILIVREIRTLFCWTTPCRAEYKRKTPYHACPALL